MLNTSRSYSKNVMSSMRSKMLYGRGRGDGDRIVKHCLSTSAAVLAHTHAHITLLIIYHANELQLLLLLLLVFRFTRIKLANQARSYTVKFAVADCRMWRFHRLCAILRSLLPTSSVTVTKHTSTAYIKQVIERNLQTGQNSISHN